jgi:hypothetical protein
MYMHYLVHLLLHVQLLQEIQFQLSNIKFSAVLLILSKAQQIQIYKDYN